MTKVKVRALTSFTHGTVDAHEGRTYEMNKGEANELEKAGLVSFDGVDEGENGEGQAEPDFRTETRYHLQEHELPPVAIAPDVPTEEELEEIRARAAEKQAEDGDDLIGGGAAEKMEGETENKMAEAPKNKAAKGGKK